MYQNRYGNDYGYGHHPNDENRFDYGNCDDRGNEADFGYNGNYDYPDGNCAYDDFHPMEDYRNQEGWCPQPGMGQQVPWVQEDQEVHRVPEDYKGNKAEKAYKAFEVRKV